MLFRVIDFETTGFPPEAGICEVGWCDVETEGTTEKGLCDKIHVGSWQSELANPGRKIEIAAMAIHHIHEEDIVNARKPEDILAELVSGVDYFVAHNAKFEKEFFKPDGLEWICTLKAAYRLCPKAPNHQNQTIRYYLNTPVNRDDAIHSHRAGPDAYVTAHTLAKFLTAVPPAILARWETEYTQFPFCPIGATERGKPWMEVERSFLAWICRQPKMDPEIKFNAMLELDYRDGKKPRPR